jgi:Cys-rich repeat protein
MNNQFDELTKNMAQSVTRRAALKKFGFGLAGVVLATFGLASSAQAAKVCKTDADCGNHKVCLRGNCVRPCTRDKDCPSGEWCILGYCGRWV